MAEFKIPVYPKTLLKTYWDKEKSLAGKAKVKDTGIGDALAAAKTAFDKIDWAAIDIHNAKSANMNQFNEAQWEKTKEAALTEVKNVAAKASAALDEVAQACDEAVKRFTVAKLPADVKLAKSIAEEASSLAAATSRMVLTEAIEAEYQAIIERAKETLEMARKAVTPAMNKALVFLKDMLSDPNAKAFNSRQGELRPFTMAIGTLLRFSRQGINVGVDEKVLEKHWDDLSPYGNSKVQLAENELPDKVLLEAQKLGRLVKAAFADVK